MMMEQANSMVANPAAAAQRRPSSDVSIFLWRCREPRSCGFETKMLRVTADKNGSHQPGKMSSSKSRQEAFPVEVPEITPLRRIFHLLRSLL